MSAWIEIKLSGMVSNLGVTSHSLWVRGLKWCTLNLISLLNVVALFVSAWIEIRHALSFHRCKRRRTLCECVDWNIIWKWKFPFIKGRTLCECVDWNKTFGSTTLNNLRSHSLWVRGLKSYNLRCLFVDNRSHSLWVRGLKFIKPVVRRINNLVALLVSAWIEIRLLNHNRYGQRGRTPCECVDWNMCVLQRKQKD